MKLRSAILVILFAVSYISFGRTRDTTERESLSVLRQAVLSPAFWVKVHAIEFLIELGYHEEALLYTDKQLTSFEQVPQNRIGLWRCKYRLSKSEKIREKWLSKIRSAYLDPAGRDRTHAAETLSKLGFSLKNIDERIVEADLESKTDLAAFVLWGNSLPRQRGAEPDFEKLLSGLDHQDPGFRKIIAYSLGFMLRFPESQWAELGERALKEPETSAAYPYLLGSAYTLYRLEGANNSLQRIREKILALKDVQDKSSRIELCRALAAKPDRSDLPLLLDLLYMKVPLSSLPGRNENEAKVANEDVRVAAAYAILCIKKSINN